MISPKEVTKWWRDRLFLAAVLAVLGTIGGALIGGNISSQATKDAQADQRRAEIQDQRRAVFADFLRATSLMCKAIIEKQDAETNAAEIEVLNQQGRVQLVAGPGVTLSLAAMTDYVLAPGNRVDGCDNGDYLKLRNAFVAAAKADGN